MRHIIISLFMTALLTGFAVQATAQLKEEQIYNPGGIYENEEIEDYKRRQRESIKQKGFIQPSVINVSLVHRDFIQEGQFGLLLRVPEVISGCWDVSPLEYEAKYIENLYFEVKVKEYRRQPIEVSNPQYECPKGNKAVTALIVMDKQDLQQRGIDEIHFKSEYGSDTYQIKIKENSVELVPESMVAFKANNLMGPREDRLIYYFNDADLVALHVPMAEPDDNVTNQVRKLAFSNALTSASSDISLNNPDAKEEKIFFFLDKQGSLLDRLNDSGYFELGTISVSRPYEGPDGISYIAVPLKVYATKPETTL